MRSQGSLGELQGITGSHRRVMEVTRWGGHKGMMGRP